MGCHGNQIFVSMVYMFLKLLEIFVFKNKDRYFNLKPTEYIAHIKFYENFVNIG